MKVFRKLVTIWGSYWQEFSVLFFLTYGVQQHNPIINVNYVMRPVEEMLTHTNRKLCHCQRRCSVYLPQAVTSKILSATDRSPC